MVHYLIIGKFLSLHLQHPYIHYYFAIFKSLLGSFNLSAYLLCCIGYFLFITFFYQSLSKMREMGKINVDPWFPLALTLLVSFDFRILWSASSGMETSLCLGLIWLSIYLDLQVKVSISGDCFFSL